ncbi:MAG: DNRLRE domain-containing protein, partial [Clostridia bacterium]
MWLEHANGSCPAQVRDGEQLAQARFAKPIEMGLTTPTCMRPADIARLTCENLYENAALGVSVRYTLCSDFLKADIILADSSALENAALHLPDDFAYTLEDENALRIADRESGDALFSLYTPIAYDAEGKETDVRMALTAYPDHTRLDFSVDPTFLQSAAYPVTIDPIINSSNALKNIQNTTLCEGSNVKPYTQTYVKVGKESSKRRVGLLKLNKLAKLSSSDTVIAAVLQMAPKSSSSSRYVAMYEVLAPWAQENVNWLTFDPDDISNISPDAQECREGSSSSWLNFDLTNLYRKWCTKTNGVSNNNGVALRTPAHISGDNYSELYSSKASSAYRPMMYVNYVSHAGLEDWWQYEQMSAERAGTVHADLFNGNMVLSHSDTLMTGNRVPISISHHYNSCLSANNAYNCGYGWKTTAHQKITARTHGDRDYYVWEDGDGTEHFFEKTAAQPYKDSEGMQLKMTFNSAEGYFIIADKQHNQLRFDVVQSGLAWLKRMRDACGSTALYTYVNGYQAQGRIDRITDPVGRETVFSYSGNLLSSIRVPAEAASSYRYVYFTYDGANRLIGVRYSELGTTGINTTYGYDGDRNLLTWARNYNGVQ